jgi:PhnB protein
MAVKPIPDGYHCVTPSLNVRGVAKLIDYLKTVFGAAEVSRLPGPGGAILHAEVRIGDSVVMLSDAIHQAPMPGSMIVYVSDVDAAFGRAVSAGGKPLMPPTNMFWGDRLGRVEDPFGNLWGIATHVEDVPPDEIPRRAAQAMSPKPA